MQPPQSMQKGTDRSISVLIQGFQDDQVTAGSNAQVFISGDPCSRSDLATDMCTVAGIIIGIRSLIDKIIKVLDPVYGRCIIWQRKKVGPGLNAGIQNCNTHAIAKYMTMVGIFCSNGMVWF